MWPDVRRGPEALIHGVVTLFEKVKDEKFADLAKA